MPNQTSKQKTVLRGVNLGGWLLMEGYLLGGRNIPESRFKAQFAAQHSTEEIEKFERSFREHFITEDDFKIISEWGANCVRVPLHYRILEKGPFQHNRVGIRRIETLLDWAEKYDLKVIIDLHAAPGGQSRDWHCDSLGEALLWQDVSMRERTLQLWEFIVERLQTKPALYGYDLLNEPVLEKKELPVLKRFYKQLVRSIRTVDKERAIFLEGNLWATQVDFLKDVIMQDVSVSIHAYNPLDFSFQLVPYYRYPGKIGKEKWDKKKVFKYLEGYAKFARKYKVDMFVGEFGVNWRGGHYGEDKYLKDMLDAFEHYGFNYTYWTYKAVKTYLFPDGIMQYLPNSVSVCRQGPEAGWDSYCRLWAKNKNDIVNTWKTKNYTSNEDLLKVLKPYFRRNKK